MKSKKTVDAAAKDAYRAGERDAQKKHRKVVKDLEKQVENNYKALSSAHQKEVAMLKKQVTMKLNRLEKREITLDKAISEWNGKIEEADRYILTAKNTLSARMIEKKEIFQRMARHIAEESTDLERLLGDVTNSREKTTKNPFYLKKTS